MSALSEKLRRAREIKIEVGELVFTALRPTDVDMITLSGTTDAVRRSELLASWVIGWAKKDGSGVSEVDLGIEHGEPHPLPFDSESCEAFLFDHVDIFQPIADALTSSYAERAKTNRDAGKN